MKHVYFNQNHLHDSCTNLNIIGFNKAFDKKTCYSTGIFDFMITCHNKHPQVELFKFFYIMALSLYIKMSFFSQKHLDD